jgi:hypothetical protein
VLRVLTAVLAIGAILTAYAWRVIFDSGQFANRAVAALQDDAVREQVADRATNELIRRHPDLLAARPAIVSVVSGVVGSDAFAALLRRGVRDVHAAVFRRDRNTITLTAVDIGVIVSEALRLLRPQLADELSSDSVVLLNRDLGSVGGDLVRVARDLRLAAIVLAVLTLAAALALRSAWRIGTALAAAGVVVAIAVSVGKLIVRGRYGAVGAGVYEAYFGDLRTAGFVAAGFGAVVAAAARSLIRPLELEEPLLAAYRWLTTEPTRRSLRALRGVALLAAGVVVVISPTLVLQLAGVYVGYKGVEALLRLINGPSLEVPRVRRGAVGAVAGVLVAGLAAVFFVGGGASAALPAAARCDLCDRRLDQITLPATHNAMSVPLPGWYSSLQEYPIKRQLEDGIRGLLLDTHYGDRLGNGRVRTVIEGGADLRELLGQDAVSDSSAQAALRLRDRIGFKGDGVRGIYLCHTFCELGATPLDDVLGDIREFLVTHPDAVLVIVNQDYVTPKDIVAAFKRAGLDRYAFTPGDTWPTLREMVDSDRRLVVLAEHHAGAAPWYQLAYQRLVQETPFEFRNPTALEAPSSCDPNRGPSGAPLFLINHWINSDPAPRPSNAAIVNAYGPLLARARECERIRRRPVNLLAVDFYKEGDLFRVVDTLNAQ